MKKKILVALLIAVMLSSLVSCKEIKKLIGKFDKTVVAETPAVPEKPVEPAKPVESAKPAEVEYSVPAAEKEPVIETENKSSVIEESAAVLVPVEKTEKAVTAELGKKPSAEYVDVEFSVAGYNVAASVGAEHAKLVYPAFVSKDDINGFARYISKKYPAYVNGLKYSFMPKNVLLLDYPAGSVTYNNFNNWVALTDAAIKEYVSVISPGEYTAVVAAAPVAQSALVAEAVPVAASVPVAQVSPVVAVATVSEDVPVATEAPVVAVPSVSEVAPVVETHVSVVVETEPEKVVTSKEYIGAFLKAFADSFSD